MLSPPGYGTFVVRDGAAASTDEGRTGGERMSAGPPRDVLGTPTCPLSLRLAPVAAMLNAEITDEVYEGIELQWFDDDLHGTGMLVFLSRTADRSVDYYVQPGLRLDRDGYRIAGGTRSWSETHFEVARLEVLDDGVVAAVRFTDTDGRLVEVAIDDRDGRRRRRAPLLAPVSAGIDAPRALLLVWMGAFDLVRVTRRAPVIRFDGRAASTGRLPGARLHRRHLIKYAGPLCSVELNRDGDLGATAGGPGHATVTTDGSAVRRIGAERGEHTAQVVLDPPFPDLDRLGDGSTVRGRWWVDADGVRLTGGSWAATRVGPRADVVLDRLERWRPGPLPWLMRVVTTAVPVFRRWPTTYVWRAAVALAGQPEVSGRWHRTGGHDGSAYRRATGS